MTEMQKRRELADIVLSACPDMTFTALEVGALPLEGKKEPTQELLELFAGSRVIAFEVDSALCDKLNKESPAGMEFHPVALGRTEERRTFYETVHPMCGSLFKPDERLSDAYNNLEYQRVKNITTLETVSLDGFSRKNDTGPIDFIKLDIQGAELDVFRGGIAALADTLMIVTEVMFIPMYENQPLFGDQCAFLEEQGFMFHKFLGMGGRTIKPIVLRNDPNFVSQNMWSDAVFIRSPMALERLSPERVLKLGVLTLLYGSIDVAIHCFSHFDQRSGTDTARRLMATLSG